jgi:hypothetical protein
MSRALLWVVLGAATAAASASACSGGSGASGGHTPHPPAPTADAGAGSGSAAASTAPLTVRECDDLIAHAVALAGVARGSGSAAPTAAELDGVAASLRSGELGVRCAALSRAAYRCAMAASTTAGLAACDPG